MKVSAKKRLIYMNMFQQYLKEYGEFYSESELEFMKDNFLEIDDISMTPDILLQIYAKFGILSKRENFYLGFAKMIGEMYGWDRDILEIAGGYYPIFSKYVSDYQSKKKKGTITVIDPKLVITELENVRLCRGEFHRDLDVSDFNLLVGISPCETTLDIVQSALINKKEFFIALCGCTNLGYGSMPFMMGYNMAYKFCVDMIYDLAREQEDEFTVNKQYVKNYPYPIIYSKRKK